jgi:hypothetical protein
MGNKIRYTNGGGEGNMFAEDANIKFFEGRGVSGSFGRTFTPRVWNGQIDYKMAAEKEVFDFVTTMAGGNGQAGNFFDVAAASALKIRGFDINAKAGTHIVQVFTKEGTYEEDMKNEIDGGLWQLIQEVTVVSLGENVPTPLPDLDSKVSIIPGEGKRGFYIKLNTGSIRYTNGNALNQVWPNDDPNLIFYQGRGVANIDSNGNGFGSTFQPRIWNGHIRFELA